MNHPKPSIDYIELTYGTSFQASVRLDKEYEERFKNNKTFTDEYEYPCSYGTLARRIMVHILGFSDPQTITYRTPTSWWQMLKRDHAPDWFKSKFPVRENVDVIEIKDIFPFPKEKFPDGIGPCVRIATLKNHLWGEE